MTDHTYDQDYSDRADGRVSADSRTEMSGSMEGHTGTLMRDLYQDFRAVPVEAWIILAVATVMSNLFIALA